MMREGYFCDLTRDQIAEWVSEFNDEALLADGLEGAFMGVCEVAGQPTVAVYDRWKCIEILAEQMDVEEYENPYIDAEEHFNFNVVGSWVGENSPRYITLHKLD
tara:strand:+ start:160 stop:471 length:312 start_codon:yes stop_codon:yes gene_type:complete